MNNEEKILNLLEKMDARQSKADTILEAVQSQISNMQGQMATIQSQMANMQGEIVKMENRMIHLDLDVAGIKADLDEVKYNTEVTRTATNTLLDWAEKAEAQIKVPLYEKSE